ncbi:hypothetical protein GCM10007320_66510 [Pseudorhodoferax aquiterrae]|uniref:Uncharacterized protein n=2 Tax=Pseudorhodoferax aquiterrae TaxID=747304 RepID=A0ABQ3GII8_9BURK|nr:hypothetical protein GCM10007320_66510 [Pseudorhodoferax aquiterrae]
MFKFEATSNFRGAGNQLTPVRKTVEGPSASAGRASNWRAVDNAWAIATMRIGVRNTRLTAKLRSGELKRSKRMAIFDWSDSAELATTTAAVHL